MEAAVDLGALARCGVLEQLEGGCELSQFEGWPGAVGAEGGEEASGGGPRHADLWWLLERYVGFAAPAPLSDRVEQRASVLAGAAARVEEEHEEGAAEEEETERAAGVDEARRALEERHQTARQKRRAARRAQLQERAKARRAQMEAEAHMLLASGEGALPQPSRAREWAAAEATAALPLYRLLASVSPDALAPRPLALRLAGGVAAAKPALPAPLLPLAVARAHIEAHASLWERYHRSLEVFYEPNKQARRMKVRRPRG